MFKRKRIIAVFLAVAVVVSLAACSSNKGKEQRMYDHMFDHIRESPVARMELPDGTNTYVDSASLYSFADLNLQLSPYGFKNNEDWLYRIVFNPTEKVAGANEIIVTFHKSHIQINSECYIPKDGVAYERILEWAKGKFDYFLK